jgi:hypothetical protein
VGVSGFPLPAELLNIPLELSNPRKYSRNPILKRLFQQPARAPTMIAPLITS